GGLVLDALGRLLPGCGAVVVSGTKAAGFEEGLVAEIARRARAAGRLLVLDVKGQDLLGALEQRPAVAKPNLAEFLATWPLPASSRSAPAGEGAATEAALRAHAARIAGELYERFGTSLVLTRGQEPTWWWDGRGLREEPVRPVAALNPTGSGDAFTAGLAAVLAEGGSLAAAVAEGTRLGALNAASLRPGSIV
ncbi:MAG: tagatose-6-phosphate kinase, partial [Spirochaetaceae bacterium]|nr:tagatose-6-phosphate kinase [Spirochaetaceae bacterium]